MAISTAVDIGAVARVVGIKTNFKNLRDGRVVILPQRIALIGQGASGMAFSVGKRQVTSANEVGLVYGYGSPLHLVAKQLFPNNGDGVGTIPVTVYPLIDADGAQAATGSIELIGSQLESGSYRVIVNGIRSEPFSILAGEGGDVVLSRVAASINAALDMPVRAAVNDEPKNIALTSKWKGQSANNIIIQIEGDLGQGVEFAITQPTGGLVNPNVSGALDQFGNVWETMVLNCLNIQDTEALTAYSNFGEGRWGTLVRKPLIVFTGNTTADVNSAVLVSDARKRDKTNVQLVAPDSIDLPFVVAARQLARIVKVANENPACDYGSQIADGINPGEDGKQWLYNVRDMAVKKGSSTIEIRDNQVFIGDVVTFYHPEGEENPPYRYVCDIVKLQNIIFNLNLIFAVAEWDGAPLIPNDQPTTNPRAKKLSMAVAAIASLVDSLVLNAIISDAAFTKKNTFAQINEQNPKRLDVSTTVKLSGNTNILSVDLNFGFYFGNSVIVG